jgi:hypothetical protein
MTKVQREPNIAGADCFGPAEVGVLYTCRHLLEDGHKQHLFPFEFDSSRLMPHRMQIVRLYRLFLTILNPISMI